MWILIGVGFAVTLYQNYGGGCPKDVKGWIAELLVGQMFMLGTTLYAVGRYLGGKK
jgi:hypothetical protein